MSELVNRIKALKIQIAELQSLVAEERGRYVDEVDHSEALAYVLSVMGTRPSHDAMQMVHNILQDHYERRNKDEDLPPLPILGDND